MDRQAFRHTDERLNEVSDKDALWGPLVSFRPAKNQCFTAARVLALAATFGGFYGLFLDLMLAFICKVTRHPMPHGYVIPLLLTFTYFAGVQLTLGPAWNRRARLLIRRADYLQSIGRPSDQLR